MMTKKEMENIDKVWSHIDDVIKDKDSFPSSAHKFCSRKVHMPEGQALFLAIHKQALALGLTPKQLQDLPQIKNIRRARWSWFWQKLTKVLSTLTVVFAAISLSWTLDWPIPRKKMAAVGWHLMGEKPTSKFVESQSCLIRASPKVQDLARPPIKCNFCRDVRGIARLKDISQREFVEKYAYSGHPLVVENGARNWSAVNTFSFDYFKNIYKPNSPTLENVESQCQFFPYKTEFGNLGEVFNMDVGRAKLEDGSKPWYIGWSNCDTSAGNELRAHYSKPYFIPDNSESSNTDWLFMGSPGYGAHMHLDNVRLPSWQAQITGFKLWTLQPPSECLGECVSSLRVTVRPGEIIVLDTNKWFHSTLNVGSDISITIGSEFD